MKKFILVLFFLLVASNVFARDESYKKVRMSTDDPTISQVWGTITRIYFIDKWDVIPNTSIDEDGGNGRYCSGQVIVFVDENKEEQWVWSNFEYDIDDMFGKFPRRQVGDNRLFIYKANLHLISAWDENWISEMSFAADVDKAPEFDYDKVVEITDRNIKAHDKEIERLEKEIRRKNFNEK